MRRSSFASMLNCPINARERAICDDLRASCPVLTSDANLVRAALYHFAVHMLGHGAVDVDTFRLQVFKGTQAKRQHRARGERTVGRPVPPLPLFAARRGIVSAPLTTRTEP